MLNFFLHAELDLKKIHFWLLLFWPLFGLCCFIISKNMCVFIFAKFCPRCRT